MRGVGGVAPTYAAEACGARDMRGVGGVAPTYGCGDTAQKR
jgi:hypothetical protein